MKPLRLGPAPFFYVPGDRAIPGSPFESFAGPADWSRDLCLFRLPEHLRKRWWNLAAGDLASGAETSPGFTAFLESFRNFAAYKGIPLAGGIDVLVRPPEEATADFTAGAIVNLGDEASRVLVNGTAVPLAPGEALSAPAGATLRAADTFGKTDLDVLLVIQAI